MEEYILHQTPAAKELFAPGTVSTSYYERDMAISPSGDEIVFTLCDYGRTTRCLVSIQKRNGQWGNKKILSISGLYHDIEPFFSYNGDRLYFASNRPPVAGSERSDYNIWVSTKKGDEWQEPEMLDSVINTENDEFFPAITRNNNLYFTSVRKNGIGAEDIFVSYFEDGKYSEPVPLDTIINTSGYEFNAFVAPDENIIVFSAFGRKDGLGGGDLYFSRKDNNGSWTRPVNLGPSVNSNKLDFCPFIDNMGNLYFTSEVAAQPDEKIEKIKDLEKRANEILNGMGNIYRVNLQSLGLDR